MIAAVTALFTVLFREPIALLYNDNPEVVIMASGLMLLPVFISCRIPFR